MRIAGGTLDPRVAAQGDPLIARIAVRHDFAHEVARHKELVWSVAMAADGEVEDVDGQGQAAVGPHPPRDARPSRGAGFREDLVDPLRLGVARHRGGDFRRQQQRDAGFVRAQQAAAEHLFPQVKREGSHAGRRGREDVQERAPRGRPTAACESVLLAVDRQVVAVLGRDDFRGHAGVVAVSLDEALRPRWFFHAAGRLVFAGVLGDPRHADLELGPLEFQHLLGVVADQLPRAVRGAVGHFRRRRQRDFVARDVGGERLVAGLPWLAAATLVLARPGSPPLPRRRPGRRPRRRPPACCRSPTASGSGLRGTVRCGGSRRSCRSSLMVSSCSWTFWCSSVIARACSTSVWSCSLIFRRCSSMSARQAATSVGRSCVSFMFPSIPIIAE